MKHEYDAICKFFFVHMIPQRRSIIKWNWRDFYKIEIFSQTKQNVHLFIPFLIKLKQRTRTRTRTYSMSQTHYVYLSYLYRFPFRFVLDRYTRHQHHKKLSNNTNNEPNLTSLPDELWLVLITRPWSRFFLLNKHVANASKIIPTSVMITQ